MLIRKSVCVSCHHHLRHDDFEPSFGAVKPAPCVCGLARAMDCTVSIVPTLVSCSIHAENYDLS
jgi:hypothetical protein